VPRCAGPPRLRSHGYDLRRAPCIHPRFASNAAHEGLNQRFLSPIPMLLLFQHDADSLGQGFLGVGFGDELNTDIKLSVMG